jgi:hypothetical protein
MPADPIAREPRQTFRATPPDPNEGFPGATSRPRGEPPPGGEAMGRSPFPEQPDGRGPYRPWSNAEEAERAFQQRRAEAEAEAQRARESGEWTAGQRSTNRPSPQDAQGRWPVAGGYVVSDAGGPIRFGDQRRAARWIISEGQTKSPDQSFEIAVHPSGQGFTVRERGRTAPPRRDGGTGAAGDGGASGAGGAADPGPRLLEGPAPRGDGAAPGEPRLRGAAASPADVVPDDAGAAPISARPTPGADMPRAAGADAPASTAATPASRAARIGADPGRSGRHAQCHRRGAPSYRCGRRRAARRPASGVAGRVGVGAGRYASRRAQRGVPRRPLPAVAAAGAGHNLARCGGRESTLAALVDAGSRRRLLSSFHGRAAALSLRRRRKHPGALTLTFDRGRQGREAGALQRPHTAAERATGRARRTGALA